MSDNNYKTDKGNTTYITTYKNICTFTFDLLTLNSWQ